MAQDFAYLFPTWKREFQRERLNDIKNSRQSAGIQNFYSLNCLCKKVEFRKIPTYHGTRTFGKKIMDSSLFSIGHGQKTSEEFLAELRAFGIEFLVDVRSCPYSKWAPQFNQDAIAHFSKHHGIKYLYMGDVIGGRPTDSSCYDHEGFVDYKQVARTDLFKSGLRRLVSANTSGYRVAIMCSESDPRQCHRSKLIGRELYFENGIDMTHIISSTQSIREAEIITELTKGAWSSSPLLFCDFEKKPYFKSRTPCKKETELEAYYD